MYIKEKPFVYLGTKIAKCENPGDKDKQPSVQLHSTKKYWIWLNVRIVDTNLKENLL